MPRLSLEERRSRLALDFEVVQSIRTSLWRARAFRSVRSWEAKKPSITDRERAGDASFYEVVFAVKTLVGPGEFSNRTTILIDLAAADNFPFDAPVCWAAPPVPWSPHFLEAAPICLGAIWRSAEGRMLLGHLLVHLAKLLNWDEPGGRVEGGYNPDATTYWREELGGRPITRGLAYPAVTVEMPSEEREATRIALFRPLGEGRSSPLEGVALFRPLSDEEYRPRRRELAHFRPA